MPERGAMPLLSYHHYVIRPKERLLRELDGERSLFGVDRPQVWIDPTAGDHDYEGQEADGVTVMKLVFLAELHRTASCPHASEDAARVAQRLIDKLPLTEEFFDERWTVEDLGPPREVEHVTDRLRVADIQAVQGPDRAIPNNFVNTPERTIQDGWRDRAARRPQELEALTEFCVAAIVELARRFEQSAAHFASHFVAPPGLEATLARHGIALDSMARLRVTLQAGRPRWGAREMDFVLLEREGGPRSNRRLKRGSIVGELDSASGEWSLDMKTIEWTAL